MKDKNTLTLYGFTSHDKLGIWIKIDHLLERAFKKKDRNTVSVTDSRLQFKQFTEVASISQL